MLQENLKNLRTRKGLSQEELADRLNVVRQTVSKWEKGLSVPDSEMLIRIAEVFEVSVGELLGETIQPEPEKSELQQLSDKLEHLNAMMAELMGRENGICAGRAGKMHQTAPEVGLLSANGIVGASETLATGHALYCSLFAPGRVSVAFFGDGDIKLYISTILHEKYRLTVCTSHVRI